jgi:hypothetical protein
MTKQRAHYSGKSKGFGAGRSRVETSERRRNPRLRPVKATAARNNEPLPRWLRVLLYGALGVALGILGAAIARALG